MKLKVIQNFKSVTLPDINTQFLSSQNKGLLFFPSNLPERKLDFKLFIASSSHIVSNSIHHGRLYTRCASLTGGSASETVEANQ
jgi:hypothetical protein